MMLFLRRLSRASIGPKASSSIYFPCEKYGNKCTFQSETNPARRWRACSHQIITRGMTTTHSSVRGLDSDDAPSFQLPSKDSNVKIEKNHDLQKELKLLLRETPGKRRQYISDRNVAEILVHHLKRDLTDEDIIVESSPGLGVLTEILLAETINDVVLYEPNKILRAKLQTTLLPKNSHRLQINQCNLEKFYGYYVVDKKEPEKSLIENFLGPIIREQKSGLFSPVKIVGVIYEEKFISKLVLCYAFQCSLYGEISPILYIFIPMSIYNKFRPDSNCNFSSQGLLFSYYFTIEKLHDVPREGFYPIFTKRKKKRCDDPMCLVKISPREEFFQDVPKKDLENFHYFINTISRVKRSDTLIRRMECWIPECGPKLIKNGIHVFAHPKELSKEELLKVYRIFINLPSYKESTFHYQKQQYVSTFGQKTEGYEMEERKSSDEIIELDEYDIIED